MNASALIAAHNHPSGVATRRSESDRLLTQDIITATEYAWKKDEHPKRGEFSPDFFIKQDDCIFGVEIKGDEEISDPSPERAFGNQLTDALASERRLELPQNGAALA